MSTSNAENDRHATCNAFADSARDLLGRVDHRARARRLRQAEPCFEREIWQTLANAGWLLMLISEEQGGLGLSMAEVAAVGRVVGENLLPEPFVAAGVQPVLTLKRTPLSEMSSRLLVALGEGSLVIGVGWQELVGQLDSRPRCTVVHDDGGRPMLSGSKVFVEPGAGSDGWLVHAMAPGENVLVWVPRNAPGATLISERRIDGCSWSKLLLDRVKISEQDILARGDSADAAVSAGIDGARLIQSAELVGVGHRALEITLDYVKTRIQFGRPIGSFQALQHRMVDARIQLELAAASLDEVLRSGNDRERIAERASRTKARAAHAALGATRLSIQLHGAIGNTDDCEIGLYFKRALGLNASLGTGLQHRRRYLEQIRRSRRGKNLRPNLPADADSTDWERLSDDQIRCVIRQFLEENYPENLRHLPRNAHWAEVRDWYATLSKQGWTAPAWPKAYGGMGLSPSKLMVYHEEMIAYGIARWVDIAVEMLGPLLISFGTDKQRETYLPRILSGEHVWCQGYSEPNAGSDLVAMKTSAVIEGESFRINGRKIWTSYAQEATHMFLLARTDKSVKPALGISFLLVDMKTPGISVREIADLRGDATFCEVVFDDVLVPSQNLVGGLNQGWAIAKALLGYERLFIANPAPVAYAMTQLRSLANQRGLFDDPGFCARYVDLELDLADLSAFYNRFADILRRGEQVTHDISMLKIVSTDTWQRTAAFLSETGDEQGACLEAQQVGGEVLQLLSPAFNAIPSSIYGGSNEIQRNIVARQVLGLP